MAYRRFGWTKRRDETQQPAPPPPAAQVAVPRQPLRPWPKFEKYAVPITTVERAADAPLAPPYKTPGGYNCWVGQAR
jgi:hypothetical protein